jgi:hypothetical protein
LSDGIDENAKISAAHATTGSHSETSLGAGTGAMIGSPAIPEDGGGTRCESGTVPPL